MRHIAKKHDSELIGEPEVGSVADAHSCCILTTLDGEIFDAAKKKGGGDVRQMIGSALHSHP